MQREIFCMARRTFLRRVSEGRCAAVLGDEIAPLPETKREIALYRQHKAKTTETTPETSQHSRTSSQRSTAKRFDKGADSKQNEL
jgi:hypothetical protein